MNHRPNHHPKIRRASALALLSCLVSAAATISNPTPAAANNTGGAVYWDDSPTLSCASSCQAWVSVTAWASGSTQGSPWVIAVASTGACGINSQSDTASSSGSGSYFAKAVISVSSGGCNSKFRITWVNAP